MTSNKIDSKLFARSDQICRLCLGEECLSSVIQERDLQQWISEYLSIVVSSEDRMSHLICTMCRIRIIEFHQFRVRSQEVQSFLQNMVLEEGGQSEQSSDQRRKSKRNTDSGTTIRQPVSRKEICEHTQCDICQKVFETRKQLTDHRRCHRSKKHGCAECYKKFGRRERLKKHMEKHANKLLKALETNLNEKDKNIGDLDEAVVVKLEAAPVSPNDSVHDYDERSDNETHDKDDNEALIGIEDMIEVEEVKIETRTENDDELDKKPITISHFLPGEIIAISCDDGEDDENKSNQSDTGDDHAVVSDVPVQSKANDRTQQYQCNECQKQCQTKQKLSFHYRLVHGPKNHKCLVCGLQFTLRQDMKTHMRTTQHLNKLRELSKNKTSKAKYENTRTHKLKTDSVDITKITPEIKQGNLKTISTSPQEQDNALFCDKSEMAILRSTAVNSESPREDNSNHSDDLHICFKCDRSFKRKGQLKNHMKSHNEKLEGELSTDREVLEAGIDKLASYNLKKRSGQPITKDADSDSDASIILQENECNVCRKVFKNHKNLKNHMRHHGVKKHVCNVCGYSFVRSDYLNNHMKTHTSNVKQRKTVEKATFIHKNAENLQPFQCDICYKVCLDGQQLRYHKRSVHGPRNHVCLICEVRFTKRFNMTKHLRTKTHLLNLRSKLTDKITDFNNEGTTERVLQNESRIDNTHAPVESIQDVSSSDDDSISGHSESVQLNKEHVNNEYACSKCNRTFKRQCQLENHLRTHDNVWPQGSLPMEFEDGDSSISEEGDSDSSS